MTYTIISKFAMKLMQDLYNEFPDFDDIRVLKKATMRVMEY